MTLVDKAKGDVVLDTLTVDAAIEEVKDGASEKDVTKLVVAFREDSELDDEEDDDCVIIAVYCVREL